MTQVPIFLQPTFHERIWGGDALQHYFGYTLPSGRTGECWAISAHPKGESIVREGSYAGLTLGQLWSQHPYLFGHGGAERFPLLIKLIDAQDDLSVQVHPDDAYAARYEGGQAGKTEAWYVLACREGAEIVYGHACQSLDEFKELVAAGKWKQLLRRVPVKPGDCFEVPSGLVHALGTGMLVYEVQQNSDLTYRLYDYDRLDANGQRRELHLEQALANISLLPPPARQLPRKTQVPGARIETLVENRYFGLQKWTLQAVAHLTPTASYLLVSVIAGQGQIQTSAGSFSFLRGDHLIIPRDAAQQFSVQGNSEWLVAYPPLAAQLS